MKIAVIGAGIVGMSTAHALAQDGHAVSIFERHASVAEEASFACAGHLGTSLLHPLSFPAWPSESRLRSLFATAGIALGGGSTFGDMRWLKAWKSPGNDFEARFLSAHSLLAYSLQELRAAATQAAWAFEKSQGQLVLFKTEAEQQAQTAHLQRLNQLGTVGSLLTAAEVRAMEPALDANLALHGGMYFAHDEVGNCRQFAQLLKERFVECGGELHIGTHVIAIAGAARPEIQTQNKGTLAFDRVVICTGATGANLAIPELKGLALAHVSSTSVSAQIREPLNAPRNAVMDWHNRISISRLGTRIRISGGASLGRRPSQVSQRDQRRLFQTLQSHFPGAADFSRSIQIWQGTSAFSPDALPLIGASERPGVWLNLAHGHNGWGMAFGAARLIADQIGDKPAAIDTTRLKPGRFKS